MPMGRRLRGASKMCALAANKGWRIDHILATPPLAQRCQLVDVDLEPRRATDPSDHTVLWAEFST